MPEPLHLLLASLAALAAGFVNGIAGGGTLITFPVLMSLGLSPVAANITNTLAIFPGTIGGVYAQRRELAGLKKILYKLIPVSIIGGLTGGLILLHSPERSFNFLVPFLILLASLLLAIQTPVKNFVQQISTRQNNSSTGIGLLFAVFFASLYGGYFGAGLGVILLSALGIFLHEKMNTVNTLKQIIALLVNGTAAIYFAFSDQVNWYFVICMAIAASIGGYAGSKAAGRLNPAVFKWTVVGIGLIIGCIYLYRNFS